MKMRTVVFVVAAAGMGLFAGGCSPQKAEQVKTVQIADGTIDPAEWGKAYPVEYEMWKKTADAPETPGLSKYKRGNDNPKSMVDKLSEYPYLALLFNGWGFGIGYNEPRGHSHMVQDQLDIDASRVKAGGVCLTCKTPYVNHLVKTMGPDYYKTPYKEVLAKIPDQKNATLSVACSDCHNNKDMSLMLSRDFTLGAALRDIGVDTTKLDHQTKRTLVCAQCHVTYVIPKDKEMHSTGVFFPWQGSKLGNITIENIIKKIQSDPSYGEWKQTVTGFKLGFIRHPEYELFSNNSVHWKAGASCADCHMPYTKVGSHKASDHRITSPLKNGLKGCLQCHAESPEWLKGQVIAIQDRTVSLQIRAGYATATVAKLFEMTHKAQAAGKTIDKGLYDKAKEYYEEAFYRCTFIGAENSVGFHNPSESLRVLGDSVAFATKAEALLRQALAQAGVSVPAKVDLELAKYLNDRGAGKLKFRKELELPDPSGVQNRF
ncbi:ammonia-forming cytochrome c nitrite reductase subunit c552 [Oryzomonas sagensis]|uniref:nitrite reductase (cytochrome; ammonia-forming) n=1 Tax=Oryzomonas sagensis TaxID=2603857 RepID=A0ABQ6TQ18_9BACT|nr:ammonia-forming cytochrome c nitrite reductase subunit c552 [Oryzomonas sagensis]KAB0671119.1 ammonia-forming cytochrome c nitrite reductase subunit c552 [Oryzomonas sagensis]